MKINCDTNIYDDPVFCEEDMGYGGCAFVGMHNPSCCLFGKKLKVKKMESGAWLRVKCTECKELYKQTKETK